MPELITLGEMKQYYSNEWLLIDCTELDENLNILRGRILAHSLPSGVFVDGLLGIDLLAHLKAVIDIPKERNHHRISIGSPLLWTIALSQKFPKENVVRDGLFSRLV